MRAAWRLAISTLSRRRTRTYLLAAAVALSAMLVAAVGVGLGSVRHAIQDRMLTLVGKADVRVKAASEAGTMSEALLTTVRSMPGVRCAAPRLEATASLRFGKPAWRPAEGQTAGAVARTIEFYQVTTRITGIDPAVEPVVHDRSLVSGRLPVHDDEIVIDATLARRLSDANENPIVGRLGLSVLARGTGKSGKAEPGPDVAESPHEAARLTKASQPEVGDTLELVRFGKDPIRLRICGLAPAPPLGGSPLSAMTISGLAKITDQRGKLSRIDVMLEEGIDAEEFVAALTPSLPRGVNTQTSAKISAGVQNTVRANNLGFLIANVMAVLAAGFITATGLSTGVTERQRELAVLRCIGASKSHLAWSQLLIGGLIGLIGAGIGVPIGVLLARWLLAHFENRFKVPPVVTLPAVLIPVAAAVVAGLVGAVLPAWQASRVSPLKALASRAVPPAARFVRLVTVLGLVLIGLHAANFTLVRDGTWMFNLYITVGLPALMIGYFCLGVPSVLVASGLLGPVLERLLALPRGLLRKSTQATPYRFGFTAGALMGGLALLIAVWTQGGSAVRDWISRVKFPDGFAMGLNMPAEAERALREVPFVTDACAISMHPVETDAFGIGRLTKVKTFFFAFDPEPFFRMSSIDWVQGDPATAIEKLRSGGAVIVAREFLTARGMGVGGTFTCRGDDGKDQSFEIVGVVNSPGLEMADAFFDVGEEVHEQRVHAVFGSRQDLRDRFGVDHITLLQFSLRPDSDDAQALPAVREALMPYGVLNVGSGRQIRETITGFMRTGFTIVSWIAVFAMLTASFGVANLVVAGVQARRFEFGVMRAVGAMPGTLTRLVLAETLLVAAAAGFLGVCMGLQGAFGGSRLDAAVWGISLRVKPPWVVVLLGLAVLTAICLAAAWPAASSLRKAQPRVLLASMRG